ncbi:hypothetical protein CPLU01_10299 [Colletotrichum plurivorum]|uniref:Uncharacterized protein n=1 Tax=Colletotrichum plurivorum TaxID=2175906 RepID=A0A8H6K5U0_9PEZI|nr:hypothetical protein CPLU01_10299 [Colletotrichum plurivorum]
MLSLTGVYEHTSSPFRHLLPHDRRLAPARNEKEKKSTPVRRPSTPTPPARPKARPRTGTRSSPPPIQTSDQRPKAAVLADSSGATRVFFTLGRRGYQIINQGGICGFFGKPRRGRIL